MLPRINVRSPFSPPFPSRSSSSSSEHFKSRGNKRSFGWSVGKGRTPSPPPAPFCLVPLRLRPRGLTVESMCAHCTASTTTATLPSRAAGGGRTRAHFSLGQDGGERVLGFLRDPTIFLSSPPPPRFLSSPSFPAGSFSPPLSSPHLSVPRELARLFASSTCPPCLPPLALYLPSSRRFFYSSLEPAAAAARSLPLERE